MMYCEVCRLTIKSTVRRQSHYLKELEGNVCKECWVGPTVVRLRRTKTAKELKGMCCEIVPDRSAESYKRDIKLLRKAVLLGIKELEEIKPEIAASLEETLAGTRITFKRKDKI